MEMDADKLIKKYPYITRKEIDELIKTNEHEGLSDAIVESTLSSYNSWREHEKMNGTESFIVGPLINLLSVKFLPNNSVDYQPPLPISGRLSTQSGKMIFHDGEVVGSDGNGYLKLKYPPQSSWSFTCMPLHDTHFVVDLVVGGKTLGKRCISCEDDVTDFEQVTEKNVVTDIGAFNLRYIVMPFAIYGHILVTFHHQLHCKLAGRGHSFVDVMGKISARYGNLYKDHNHVECVLFDKPSDEFERVDFEQQGFLLKGIGLNLSRCWVSLPVYSSLVVDLDLMEFSSSRKLVKEILEFQIGDKCCPYKNFIVDDILIKVEVVWDSPMPQEKLNVEEPNMDYEDESSDDEMSIQGTSIDNIEDEQMIESSVPEVSSNLKRRWLGVHQNRPFPSSLVEIYCISIGRDKLKALQMYGFVEISSLGNAYYCFKKESSDAFCLAEGNKTLPLLDGSLVYDDCESLKMNIDLKDVESSLCIKGYVDWDDRTLEFGTKWFNKPLCSVVKGQLGFAAIYYSFFPEAVKANLTIFCALKQKIDSGNIEVFPKVYGSIVAQHDYFDYTGRYNKNYFRVALFERKAEDPLQISASGAITLSRSMVVVPLRSSLVVGLSLSMFVEDNQISINSSVDLQIGTSSFRVESESKEYSIIINVKWLD